MSIEAVPNTDTLAWSDDTALHRNWLWDVVRLPAFYIAVGDRANILTSDNGIDWDLEAVPESVTNSVFLGINGDTNALLVAGSQGTLVLSRNDPVEIVRTNENGTLTTNLLSGLGVLWNAVEPRPTTNDLQGVTLWQNQFVVSGGLGTILTSPDAIDWTPRATPTSSFLSSLESFPGGLVAVGENGTILVSPDAGTWTTRHSGTDDWLYRVRFRGDRLVAVGENGAILTSTDGIEWTRRSSPTDRWLNDVEHIDGTWFIVGNQGTALASTNAIDWVQLAPVTHKSLYAAAQHQSQLLAVGIEGVILRAPIRPLLDPIQFLAYDRTDEFDLFLLGGLPDQLFRIEHTPSLPPATPGSWIPGPLLEFLDSSGTALHISPTPAPAAPSQFYRARVVP
jgi:hypothetical protein